MDFSITDAAKRAGISRSSMYRLIDEGKLSCSIDYSGKKRIDLSEILRFFGQLETPETVSGKDKLDVSGHSAGNRQDTLISVSLELDQLRAQLRIKELELQLKDREIALAQERTSELKRLNDDVMQEKKKLLEIIEKQTFLLAAPVKVAKVRSKAKATLPIPAKVAQPPVKESEPEPARKKGKVKKAR